MFYIIATFPLRPSFPTYTLIDSSLTHMHMFLIHHIFFSRILPRVQEMATSCECEQPELPNPLCEHIDSIMLDEVHSRSPSQMVLEP